MSFSRHGEIYRSDGAAEGRGRNAASRWPAPGPSQRARRKARAPLIVRDEFPVGYSSAGCSPAEPASASPTAPSMRWADSAGNQIPSAVTSKPANGGHPKTGQWKTQFGQHLLYPAQPRFGKEFQGKKFLWRAPEGREPRSSWRGKKPSPTLWECGNRAVGDFQARWETTGNRRLVFRVFHGAAFP